MLALQVRDLVKTYPNGVQALRGLDLDVPQGEFFALLGPNGAGKTTLIGIITSLVNKTAGEVRVFGHDLGREAAAARACVGVVPQEININYWDSVQNIVTTQAGFYGMTPRRARSRAETCLRRLQLWDRRRDSGRSLSGGMKRRLMIARALVHEPRLLILDEPTAGVDIEIRRSMWDLLRELNEAGTTIILTTHYLEEAECLCRHVAIIDHGRIVERDAMARVLRKLHAETFVLNLREVVTAAPALPGYDVRHLDDHQLEVEVTKDQDLNGVFAALSAAGLHVISMRNKANRLEELFMRLTAREGATRAVEEA
ncbi:MAG: ABC transporter ATP-binding protein [Gammaproteobacteria bacterium]|nr:ABC transporter ATP-binding protein [Gammaproteobacteria bacterium]